jgi:transcriptional regulator with XRE-family HTH domain
VSRLILSTENLSTPNPCDYEFSATIRDATVTGVAGVRRRRVTQKTGRPAALEGKRQLFAAELRHWRAVRRLSLRQLATRTHDSHSLLGRIETAERLPSKELAERLDQALNTDGAFVRIWGQIESALEAQADQVGVDPDLGLTWGRTPASTVTTVSHLWRADMDRRQLIVGAAWTAAAFLDPSRRWFADAIDPDTSHAGPRRIGSSEVQVMWSMARAFADADHHLGGGYARRTLM